jgi:Cys-rich protein (TIGR01571 family)
MPENKFNEPTLTSRSEAQPTKYYEPPHDQIQTGAWGAAFFDCFSNLMPNCFMSFCLPFVSMSQIFARLEIMSYWVALPVFTIATLAEVICFGAQEIKMFENKAIFMIIYVIITTFLTFSLTYLRWKVRTQFQIPGNVVIDCSASFWCGCCTLAQMATHVKSYKPGQCGFGAPDVLPAYKSEA